MTGDAPEQMPRPRDSGPLPHRIRHRFPIFDRLVYINSCSQGALSDAVRKSYDDYLRDWDDEGAPWEYWVERAESARAAFATIVNADPDEVAVTTSLSAGLSALASGLRYARRSKILTTEIEFPTVGQIWHAQETRGARVVHVPPERSGRLDRRGHAARLGARTSRTGRASSSGSSRSSARRTSAARSSSSTPTRPRARCRSTSTSSASTSSPPAPSSTCSARPASRSSTRAATSSSACGRRRRAGSQTRASSRWTSATTRRRAPLGDSRRARRRSRRSTRASPASGSCSRSGWRRRGHTSRS